MDRKKWHRNVFINLGKEINNYDPKLKTGDHVGISEYKNIFSKDYVLNWSEEDFVIKKVKIVESFWKKFLERFTKKNCKKQIKKSLEFKKKVIKRKSNKLYVKWKGYDKYFKNWFDKKDIS